LGEIPHQAVDLRGRVDANSGWYHIGFLDGLRIRRAMIQAEMAAIHKEAQGARDALAQAFEAQKKYEHIAEQAMVLERKEVGRRETAALDELGLRKAAR
jgi:flagellar FliJ protein